MTGRDTEVNWPAEGDWYVLHTRSRQEKMVAYDLAAMGIGYFLPLLEQVRYYGRSQHRAEVPMFPGYIFLRGGRDDAFTADRTRRIAKIIPVADQDTLDWELKNIRLALTKRAPLDPFPYLSEGVRVEVQSGPFKGLQGVVEDREAPDRLCLQVDMLGRAMSLTIDGSLLVPIE